MSLLSRIAPVLAVLLSVSVAPVALMPVALAQQPAAPAAPTPSGPTPLGQFGDWQAFENGTGKSKSCFVTSSPKDRQPSNLNRDPATLFVTHRPKEGVRNELNIAAGFPMKEGDTASLTIGTATYVLYAKDRGAWVKDPAQEPAVLADMKKGRDLVFEGVSKRNNKTTDRYSLSGLSQALAAIAKACP